MRVRRPVRHDDAGELDLVSTDVDNIVTGGADLVSTDVDNIVTGAGDDTLTGTAETY